MSKIKSRRRDVDARVGFVKFPRKDSTGEGGVFVRLVVIDTEGDRHYMRKWVPCCGGYVQFTMDETFLGDDLVDAEVDKLGPTPKWDPKTDKGWGAYKRFSAKVDKLYAKTEAKYFPNIHSPDPECEYRYLSDGFLAVMTIGATGWSGHWRCTFKDLTADGKRLYRTFQKLYPGCEIRLLTFLDT